MARKRITNKKYDVYNITGDEFLGTFTSLQDIADKFDKNLTSVRHSYNNNTIFSEYQVIDHGKEATDLTEKAAKKAKKVILYTTEGEKIEEFSSTLEASKKLGIPQSTVSANALSERITYNIKYYLRFEGDEVKNLYEGHQILIFTDYGKPVAQKDEDGNIVYKKYNTFEEAFESVGLTYDPEQKPKNGYKKTVEGYQFVREPHLNLVKKKRIYLVDKPATPDNPRGELYQFSTLQEIGDKLNVSRERVRQIIEKNEKKKARIKELEAKRKENGEDISKPLEFNELRLRGYRIVVKSWEDD